MSGQPPLMDRNRFAGLLRTCRSQKQRKKGALGVGYVSSVPWFPSVCPLVSVPWFPSLMPGSRA
jgi:hypothetical protein